MEHFCKSLVFETKDPWHCRDWCPSEEMVGDHPLNEVFPKLIPTSISTPNNWESFHAQRGTCPMCRGHGPDQMLCHTCCDKSNRYEKRFNPKVGDVPTGEIYWDMYKERGSGPAYHMVFGLSFLHRASICESGHVLAFLDPCYEHFCTKCSSRLLDTRRKTDFVGREEPPMQTGATKDCPDWVPYTVSRSTFYWNIMHSHKVIVDPPDEWDLGGGNLHSFRPRYSSSNPPHVHPHGACPNCAGWGPSGYICRNQRCMESIFQRSRSNFPVCLAQEGASRNTVRRYERNLFPVHEPSDRHPHIPPSPSYWFSRGDGGMFGPLVEVGICANSREFSQQSKDNNPRIPHYGPVGTYCLVSQCGRPPSERGWWPRSYQDHLYTRERGADTKVDTKEKISNASQK